MDRIGINQFVQQQVRWAGFTIAHEAEKIVNDYEFQCGPIEIKITIDPDRNVNPTLIEIKNTTFPYIREEYLKDICENV